MATQETEFAAVKWNRYNCHKTDDSISASCALILTKYGGRWNIGFAPSVTLRDALINSSF